MSKAARDRKRDRRWLKRWTYIVLEQLIENFEVVPMEYPEYYVFTPNEHDLARHSARRDGSAC